VRARFLLCCLAFASTVTACSDPDERTTDWDYLHTAILVPSCATAGCHSSLAKKAGIVLEDADETYDLLLDEQFVIPGNENSALLFLLEGQERDLMPPDAPLPEADVDLIRQWIVEGAPR
jgi:hypothetical protein